VFGWCLEARVREVQIQQEGRHTLVSLLLDLDSLGQVLVLLPLDVVTDGLVVNELATVSNVFL
jgi:hypothetical protein